MNRHKQIRLLLTRLLETGRQSDDLVAVADQHRAHARLLVDPLRQQLRHFRTDRITALDVTTQRYPRRRQVLLREWRDAEGIAVP